MYTTTQGQTWDMIAKEVYGSEIYADVLMANNLELLDIFIFPSGVEITVPELDEEITDLPEWRTEDE